MKLGTALVIWVYLIAAMGYGEPVVNSFGGVLFPAADTSIELRSLSILLEQQGEQMRVDAEYRFHNPELEKNLIVGFMTLPHIPADRQLDTSLETNIEALRAEANGQQIEFDVKPIVETDFQQELKEITDLSYVYYASVSYRNGENTVRLSYRFQPSGDSSGVGGQQYYPFTVTPAGLWGTRRVGSVSLKIKMEPGTLFTVTRNPGFPAEPNPWRLVGQGKLSRGDLTESSNDELLYVLLKNGFLELDRPDYVFERELLVQIYNPLDHLEPLKSIYWRVIKGQGLELFAQEDLLNARNTLFAFHGYKFEDPDLDKHFSRYFWYDPDPGVSPAMEALTAVERELLRHIVVQEQLPAYQTDRVSVFLDRFRRAVIDHRWSEVLEYLDTDYIQDRLNVEFGGEQSRFLAAAFGGLDPERITGLEYEGIPASMAKDKVVERLGIKISASGSGRNLNYQIRRAGDTFRLVDPHDGVTNYQHGVFAVRDARAISVKMRSVGDPYLRCYSTWIRDGSGGYINLDGADCDPETWKSSHCGCVTAAGSKEIRYDLSRYTRTPYSGDVVVAVSSYVGYWRVEVEADKKAPGVSATPGIGRPWSTAGDSSQRHAEVKDIRYGVDNGMLRGEATFLAWNRSGCPACIQQIVLISDRKTGGLYDAVCVELGIPGAFPGTEVRRSFSIRFPDSQSRIWAFPALQYSCEDAVSLARQNFLSYKQSNRPIIGD